MTSTKWFIFSAVFAFIGIVSFFQINSYWADQHHFNGIFGFLGLGIVSAVISAFGMYKATSLSSGKGPDQEK